MKRQKLPTHFSFDTIQRFTCAFVIDCHCNAFGTSFTCAQKKRRRKKFMVVDFVVSFWWLFFLGLKAAHFACKPIEILKWMYQRDCCSVLQKSKRNLFASIILIRSIVKNCFQYLYV